MHLMLWIPGVILSTLALPSDDRVSEDVRGFSGQVTGRVTAKHDDGTFTLKVHLVTRVWKDNKATNIEWFLGRKLQIGPRWAKGGDGQWRKSDLHVRFIQGLKVGADLRLEIRFAEGQRFAILELSGEQRERAARDDRRSRDTRQGTSGLAPGVRGFSGQVAGIVRSKHDDGTFIFEVARVLEVWRDSKASRPETLAGMKVRIGPRWEKGEGGKWHRCESHVEFIRKLDQGEDYRIEIRNAEANHFQILELSKEQREWIRKGEEERGAIDR